MRNKIKYFVAGAIMNSGFMSLYQDVKYGSAENYAEYILSGGWIDRAITIPIAVGAVLISAFMMRDNIAKGEESHDD